MIKVKNQPHRGDMSIKIASRTNTEPLRGGMGEEIRGCGVLPQGLADYKGLQIVLVFRGLWGLE
jgi:hypothetical protein